MMPEILCGYLRLVQLIIETWNMNMAFGIFQTADNDGKRMEWIGRYTPIAAGMQIAFRALYFDLGCDNAAQAIHQCWYIFSWHVRITNKSSVTTQSLGICFDIMLKRLAASLFLTFQEHLHIDWYCSIHLHH